MWAVGKYKYKSCHLVVKISWNSLTHIKIWILMDIGPSLNCKKFVKKLTAEI